ncbi:MAG: protein kinase [Gemmatimonadaceae bacterium]
MFDLQATLRDAVAERYLLEREVSRGGMAVLFAALDKKHDRQVALKVLRPELGHSLGAERFLREIKVTAKLQHPHVLPLYDSGDAGGGLLYYVTPFISGESLRQLLDRAGPLPIPEALRLAREVADAVAYAHHEQIIHRDIKPGNVLLSHGHAVVADFGIARALVVAGADSLTDVGLALGTPAYMSPEQLMGDDEIDGRTDIYSLGCMLFEMLTGQLPFQRIGGKVTLARRLLEDVTRASTVRPDTPRLVDELLATAMAQQRDQRFATARDCLEALDAAIASLSPVIAVRTRAPSTSMTASGAGGRANLGALVSRTCDRWRQINAFDAFFREARLAPRRHTQLCIIQGEEGQGHESLVERLIATRIASYAAEIAGEEGGTVVSFKAPWPEVSELDVAQRDLVISLFREVAPSYLGDDMSVSALVRLASTTLSPVIVVQHELRTTQWSENTDRLIRWYADEFWGSRTTTERVPLFVVFLKLIYPPEPPRFRFPFFRRRELSKRELSERVRRLVEANDARCPMTVLGELSPVSLDDVKSWFDQNNIYASEDERSRLARSLFGDAAVRPFSEIELALEKVHRDFVQEVSTQKRSVAW